MGKKGEWGEVTWIDTRDCGRYLDQNPRLWEVPGSIPEIVGGT